MFDTLTLLRSDLERQFALEGKAHRKATALWLLRRSIHPRFLPLVLCRLSRASRAAGVPLLPFVFSYLNLVLFGLQISPRCEIGPGLFLPHPSGTVIGAWRIGSNVTLFQQVTLGAKEIDFAFRPDLLPEICDNVTIGAGAKVLGGICLGNNTIVGANAVVLRSVEPNSIVGGIPARNIRKSVHKEISQHEVFVGHNDYNTEL